MRRTFLLSVLAFTLVLSGSLETASAGNQNPNMEKRFAFEMRGNGWKQVLEWLSDQSGLPVATKYPPPPGSFTFIAPTKGKVAATFTLPEVIDLLNDALSLQGYLLIRRNASITLVVQDEKIDAGVAPHIELAELKTRGRTELVSIALPLDRFGDAETAREVRALMGRFGHVVVLTQMKRVILRDTVENLQRILAITGKDQPPPKAKPDPPKEPAKKPGNGKELAQADAKAGQSVKLNYVRLVAISKSQTGHEAMLRDIAGGSHIPLRASRGFAEFRIRDFDDSKKIVLSGQVIRIDARELFFQANDQIYRLGIGEHLGAALATPLSKNVLNDLDLELPTQK